MIFAIPINDLGRYVQGPAGGQYLSCEIVPDEAAFGYTVITMDTEANIDIRTLAVAETQEVLSELKRDGYVHADQYIPSGRKKAALESGLDQDAALLKKLRGQGGSGVAEKLQKGRAKASKWDGGIVDSISWASNNPNSGTQEEISSERLSDSELETRLDEIEKSLGTDADDASVFTPPPAPPQPKGLSSAELERRLNEIEASLESDTETEELTPPALDTNDDSPEELDDPSIEEEAEEAPPQNDFLKALQAARDKTARDKEISSNSGIVKDKPRTPKR